MAMKFDREHHDKLEHQLRLFGEKVYHTLAPMINRVLLIETEKGQRHVLEHLIQHAKDHADRNVQNSEKSAAWRHEVEYLTDMLLTMDETFADAHAAVDPKDQFDNSMLGFLKALFGDNVHVLGEDDLDALLASPEKATTPVDFYPTHIHVKSGGRYQKIAEAFEEATMKPVVVYKNADQQVFTRPKEEFEDGRFHGIS